MQAPRRGPRVTTRRVVVSTVVAASLFVGLEIGAGLGVRGLLDVSQYVEPVRLTSALQTFRPSERTGLAKPVETADLAPERSVRTEPSACAPLSLLSIRAPLDAQSWTGISGSPAQPVNTLTVRYADATAARADLRDKRLALLRCHDVQLTFPPFDAAPQTFTVHARHWLLTAVSDRVNYRLDGPEQSYCFYVRRYANTLTWTYGDDVSTPEVRQQVVDDLVDRLRELHRQ